MPLFCVMDAIEIVSSAVLGIDIESVFIKNRVYNIKPPTIRRFVGAARYFRECKGDTLADIIRSMDMEGATKALSWLIEGNESLAETFMDAPMDEVVNALIKGIGMIDAKNFIRLSALQRNVRSLIAQPR